MATTAYAVYFDYRRRSHPEFRRLLRRSERRQARAEKDEANQAKAKELDAIRAAVDSAKEEGFPHSREERDRYFMDQLQEGELLAADRKWIGACCCMAAERLPAS